MIRPTLNVDVFHKNLPLALSAVFALGGVLIAPLSAQIKKDGEFHVEEASITDIQRAIQSGQTSCKQVVEQYIARAKAYNGACTALITSDGKPIASTTGMVRAGAPVKYPT